MKTISQAIEQYILDANDPMSRFNSWDHCQATFAQQVTSENHALQLGFYLASWGMYRGSGGLLQRNHLIHNGAVDIFYSGKFDEIKCNQRQEVTSAHIGSILKLATAVADHYQGFRYDRGNKRDIKVSPTHTLVTKVILGTFACVPAYDQYLLKGMKLINFENRTFGQASLREIFGFIESNQKEIEACQQKIKACSGRHYPVMKIVDMYLWTLGYDKALEEELEKIKINKGNILENF